MTTVLGVEPLGVVLVFCRVIKRSIYTWRLRSVLCDAEKTVQKNGDVM
jgi:hypothetical protein